MKQDRFTGGSEARSDQREEKSGGEKIAALEKGIARVKRRKRPFGLLRRAFTQYRMM